MFTTLLDSIGYLLVAGLLGAPIVWMIGYFLAVWFKYGYRPVVEREPPPESSTQTT